MFRPRDSKGKLDMIAYCIFYGNKYPYSNVVDLQREFKNYDVRLRCDYIKDFSEIKRHWHKLKYFDSANEDTIIIDIDQTVVGDISDMINYPVGENELDIKTGVMVVR